MNIEKRNKQGDSDLYATRCISSNYRIDQWWLLKVIVKNLFLLAAAFLLIGTMIFFGVH